MRMDMFHHSPLRRMFKWQYVCTGTVSLQRNINKDCGAAVEDYRNCSLFNAVFFSHPLSLSLLTFFLSFCLFILSPNIFTFCNFWCNSMFPNPHHVWYFSFFSPSLNSPSPFLSLLTPPCLPHLAGLVTLLCITPPFLLQCKR